MATSDFTIADVLAWARTKPADESYSYHQTTGCALCQFLIETDRAPHPSVGGGTWTKWEGAPYASKQISVHRIPEGLDDALVGRTFRQLVAKLEKLAPETPVTPSNWLKIDAYLADIDQVLA